MFFDSFGITDYDLSHYDNWVGRDGAVRVRHGAYRGTITAQVAFCLGRSQQDRLPAWQNQTSTYQNRNFSAEPVNPQPSVVPQRNFDGFHF